MDHFFGLSIRQHALKKVENNWVQRLIEISDAVMFMHSRDVLHLDLHSSNVLASSDRAKIIDFGKATLIKFTITFRLDKDERAEYNEKYNQIEDELRNQRGSQTSFCSDVYSLGRLISYIAEKGCVSPSLKPSLMQLSASCCAPRAIRSSLTFLNLELIELLA